MLLLYSSIYAQDSTIIITELPEVVNCDLVQVWKNKYMITQQKSDGTPIVLDFTDLSKIAQVTKSDKPGYIRIEEVNTGNEYYLLADMCRERVDVFRSITSFPATETEITPAPQAAALSSKKSTTKAKN